MYYRDIASRMKEAIQKGIIGEDGIMPLDFMGAYVLIIAFDLAPEEKKECVARHLIRKIEEKWRLPGHRFPDDTVSSGRTL